MKIFTLKRASCGGRQCVSELPRNPPTVSNEIFVEFSRNVVRLISTAKSFTHLYIGDPTFLPTHSWRMVAGAPYPSQQSMGKLTNF
jgi:hypothetical protein